jgi:hypothetical protein
MRFTTFPILLLALVASAVVADNEDTPNRYKCDTAGELECDATQNSFCLRDQHKPTLQIVRYY